MNILFLNATTNSNSRTLYLSKYLLSKLDGEVKEVKIDNSIKMFTNEMVLKRDELKRKNDFSDPMFDYAKDFQKADIIVIAAPFWDLSFPTALKAYIENISVSGVTFTHKDNMPVGLCKAKMLYYVSTAGGKYFSEYGFEYIKAISTFLFGIKNYKEFYAESLDIEGTNVKEKLEETKKEIDEFFK